MLKIIAAVARNRVIGKGGILPWYLPDDLKWFKRITNHSPVIMGRKTFDSLPPRFRPLPGRENIVLTREYFGSLNNSKGVNFTKSLSSVISRSRNEDLFVIGGAELYRITLPVAEEMYLTAIHAKVKGDIFFPHWNKSDWRLLSEEPHNKDKDHVYSFTWQVWRRKDIS